MENRSPSIVYVKANSDSYIIAVNSSDYLEDVTGWTEIDSGYGIRYSDAYGNYFEKPIITERFAWQYKLVGGKPVECTPEEIARQEETRKPKTIAPCNITAGEYITVNGVMYKAITNIPNGEPIVTGQNAVVTTIEEQLAELAKGE